MLSWSMAYSQKGSRPARMSGRGVFPSRTRLSSPIVQRRLAARQWGKLFMTTYARSAVSISIFVFAILCTPATAFEANLVTREQVDAVKLLPPPPAMGSAAQLRDMQAVVQGEKDRTANNPPRRRWLTTRSVFRFADVLGPHFTAAVSLLLRVR